MGFFDLFISKPPKCERCHEERGEDVRMEAGEKYAPRQGMAVSAWICPYDESHSVMREVDGEVETYDPPAGAMDRDGRDGDGRYGVVPLDDFEDDDDGWRSVR